MRENNLIDTDIADIAVDIAVIKNDIKHIITSIDGLKHVMDSQCVEIDRRFDEISMEHDALVDRVAVLEGHIMMHNKIFAALGAGLVVIAGIIVEIISWFRGS